MVGYSKSYPKLRYLKNLKLFSISAYSIAKKKRRILLFLIAFSWETDLCVTLGDFTVKKRKIEKGNLKID